MKRLAMLAFLAAALTACVAQTPSPSLQPDGRDLCLTYGENCPYRQDTIDVIIGKLEREIAKGRSVYSEKELGLLQRKLDDYLYQLEWLQHGP